jgi:hypothetical protein
MTQRSSRPQERLEHRAPSDCPVCGDELAVIRLGCASCGTEIGGVFRACEFCALNEKETEMLRVFLTSRGNLREVEKHLGVSYPTARLRFAALLEKLGLGETPEPQAALTREEILSEVASGALTPDEAQELITRL